MDLSKVLGEMYADDVPAVPAPRPTAPEWADDAHLDQAFSNWTPGPPPEAPAAEHAMAAHESHRIDDDLNAALTQALGSDQIYPEPLFEEISKLEVKPEPVVAYELAPVAAEPVHSWSRADDDVLPSAGRRGRHFGRR